MNSLKKKAIVFGELADRQVLLRLDGRHPAVIVPEHLKKEYDVPLNLNWNFPRMDLTEDGDGIGVTLSFAGKDFRCYIPWGAVWAMRCGDHIWQFMSDTPWDAAELVDAVYEVDAITEASTFTQAPMPPKVEGQSISVQLPYSVENPRGKFRVVKDEEE
jgi:hypothetical protein